MKKIVFYTNQFFGQIGGEDKAGMEPVVVEGAVGAANLFKDKIAGGEIAATVICGDNHYAENMEKTREHIIEAIKKYKPDLLIAGPAFNAGRFGMACGDICKAVNEQLRIPAVTGLYEENPAVLVYKSDILIAETGKSAADMRNAVPKMVKLAQKLINDESLGLPEEDGYIPRGIRINVFKDKTGAERALDVLTAKLNGKPYKTEVPIPEYESIIPAPGIRDMKRAKIAVITSGGVVPMGNPSHLPAATAKFWTKYDISRIAEMKEGMFESVHAGYDPVYANEDPNRVVPLDALRELEKGGEIGEIYNYLITTTGNSTSVADATRMGREIAEMLLTDGVNGVILTST